ncbi:MAG: type III secretion system chaperone [Chthoniobacterales bacterium]|nr:type III secretion system chaperone [Chthoniobacterales bacterium]
MIPSPYLSLLEALRVSCKLPEFPNPLPSTQLDLELENGPTVTIDFEESGELVVIFSQIGTYSPEQELEVLRKIAEANFLWTSSGGATLSVRPEIHTVYLAYQTPASSLTGLDFIQRVEKFVEIVLQWQHTLSQGTLEEPLNQDTNESSLNPIEAEKETALPTPGSNNYILE